MVALSMALQSGHRLFPRSVLASLLLGADSGRRSRVLPSVLLGGASLERARVVHLLLLRLECYSEQARRM